MNPVDLQAKLDELRALPGETEWVEFKHAERNFDSDDLGKYFSALSNEANLKGQSFGWLGFGIKDKTHDIVGTQFRPNRTQLDSLKQEVAVHTTNRLTFEEIHELVTPQGRVVLFQIPAASNGSPTAWKGHFYGRNGESLGPLSLHEIEQIRGQSQAFETGIAVAGIDGDGVVDRLDTEAYFRLTKQPLPANRPAILARLAEEQLIVAVAGGHYDVTNLGAILFARDLTRFGRLGRKTLRVIKYKGTNRVTTEREWHDPPSKKGYAAGFEEAIAFINSQLPQNEHIGDALRAEVRVYPEIAVRELVANTLVHQDLSVTGAGPMVEIFTDRMELTNPGEPLVDTQRFIDTPPRSRNEDLASFMRRLNICEERGSGIDKVITSIELYQLPPPDFRVPPGSTQVLLFAPRGLADMDSSERNRACYQHAVLRYISGSLMTNASLRQRFGIEERNSAKASRLIKSAVAAKLIKLHNAQVRDRDREYVPFWADPS
jgi:predicted HTH transcriptional regulator